ncbi:hypothetical protein E2C01_000154 [Portunus trituberculatus]|uniref:Uncharacterized protein n=1 Tax=Portunus trituberculatus TaxID=210409 RepID=A0A5B7CEF7_PORTR|nr:hypothetical protein [Portunus trituberculatus]
MCLSVREHRRGGAGSRAETTQKEATHPRTTYYSQRPIGSGSPLSTKGSRAKAKCAEALYVPWHYSTVCSSN